MTEHQTSFSFMSILKISLILMVGLSSCSLQNPQNENIDAPTSQPSPTPQAKIQTEVPLITPTTAPCTATKGTVIERDVPSTLLPEPIPIKIYLPPCYDTNSDAQYSVLYMLHGQTSMDDQWVGIGLLSKMDELLGQKKVNPFIIVLPTEIRSNTDSYTSKYGDSLVEELIPYIDNHYNVCTEKACRAIGGLSRGGNWAVHLGFSNPAVFTAVGAHSAPLFYGEISNILLTTNTPEEISALPVFYVDVGHKDADHADVMLFLDMLQTLSVPHKFNNNLGYHNEEYWSAHVEDYLLWYDSQLMPPSEIQK